MCDHVWWPQQCYSHRLVNAMPWSVINGLNPCILSRRSWVVDSDDISGPCYQSTETYMKKLIIIVKLCLFHPLEIIFFYSPKQEFFLESFCLYFIIEGGPLCVFVYVMTFISRLYICIYVSVSEFVSSPVLQHLYVSVCVADASCFERGTCIPPLCLSHTQRMLPQSLATPHLRTRLRSHQKVGVQPHPHFASLRFSVSPTALWPHVCESVCATVISTKLSLCDHNSSGKSSHIQYKLW